MLNKMRDSHVSCISCVSLVLLVIEEKPFAPYYLLTNNPDQEQKGKKKDNFRHKIINSITLWNFFMGQLKEPSLRTLINNIMIE